METVASVLETVMIVGLWCILASLNLMKRLSEPLHRRQEFLFDYLYFLGYICGVILQDHDPYLQFGFLLLLSQHHHGDWTSCSTTGTGRWSGQGSHRKNSGRGSLLRPFLYQEDKMDIKHIQYLVEIGGSTPSPRRPEKSLSGPATRAESWRDVEESVGFPIFSSDQQGRASHPREGPSFCSTPIMRKWTP